MAFSWRQLRRAIPRQTVPGRDVRADLHRLGRYEEAPARRDALAGVRFSRHDWTTVWGAAALGYGDVLGRMIARGADRDARDAAGDTPLIFAIDFERPEIVQVLLEAGADVDAAGRHGKRPLHHAAARGDLDLLRLLLRAGADPDPSDENGVTPLMEAVRRGSEPATRRLLEAGASVHRRDGAGRNAMFYLVPTMSASDIVGLLVDAGAEIGARSPADGDTAPHHTLRNGPPVLARLLLDAGGGRAPDARGRNEDTLLMAAVRGAGAGGGPGLVRELLVRGADPAAANRHGHTPLLVAAMNGDRPVRDLLLLAGAPVGFLEAVALEDVPRARALPTGSASGLDAPVDGRHGSPLMWAAARGRTDLVRLLLQRGADVNAASANCGTALARAAAGGHADTVRLLLEHGAEPAPGARDAPGATAFRRNERKAPDAPPPPARRATADELYRAAASPDGGDDAMLRWLLMDGTDINAADRAGNTALHLAAVRGDEAAVRRLLARGADPRRRNRHGDTAAAVAAARGNRGLRDLLEPDRLP